ISQALYGISFYTVKTFLPFGLSAYYPVEIRKLVGPQFLFCATLVVGTTLAAFRLRRRWPGLLAAWLSYLLLMSPHLGLLRIGNVIAADRYCYFSSMALAVLCGYGLCRLHESLSRDRPYAVPIVASGLVLALCVLTSWQCRTWHDSKALWTRAINT